MMHFDKDCGGPKNQTHGAGPAGQGKWLWYFGCARRLGYGPSTERVARVARHGPERSRLASPSQHQDHPARLFLSSCASSWHGGGGLKPTAQETLQTSLCPAGPAAATSFVSRSAHGLPGEGATPSLCSRDQCIVAPPSVGLVTSSLAVGWWRRRRCRYSTKPRAHKLQQNASLPPPLVASRRRTGG